MSESKILSNEEMDQMLQAISMGEMPSLEEVRDKKDHQRKIKIYDFNRPDKFSKEQTRTVRMMHEVFARLTSNVLAASLQVPAHVNVVSVDQLAYEEFIRSTYKSTTLAVVEMDPLKGAIILEIDPNITSFILERLMGSVSKSIARTKRDRELTEIETSVMEGTVIKMLGGLREAWNTIIDLRPRLSRFESNPQFAQIVPNNEMCFFITLETRIEEVEGFINLCIPFVTIESIIPKLSTQYMISAPKGINPGNVAQLRERLATADIQVIAEIGSVDVPMKEVIALKVDDIIKLHDVGPKDPIFLKVGDQYKFNCRPGMVGRKIAVQITKKLDNTERISTVENDPSEIFMEITVELGRTKKPIREIMEMREGSIVELDKYEGEPVDILVNQKPIAKGEVVVVDSENFGVRVTSIGA
jgi:flagellar motor switch protein FliM